jgi:hypothetical protein
MKADSPFPQSLIRLPLIFCIILGLSEELLAQPTYQTNFASVPQQSSIPFNNNLNNKVQWLYYPADFGNPPSGFIDKIYIKAAQSMLPVINNLNDFTIKMGATTLTSLPPGPWITANMNTVFYSSNLNIWPMPGQWMEITLQTPFYFNNTQKFIVEASQSSYTVGFDVMQGGLTARSLYGNLTSPMANSQNYLCDFGFTLTQGPADASLEEILNLNDTVCSGTQAVQVVMKNYGPAAITNASIQWTINNVAQNTYTFTGNLAPNASTTINLGTVTFQSGQPYQLKAWVHNPNNLPDLNPVNDTILYMVGLVIPAPDAHPQASSYLVCPGDTAHIPIILSGTPPWNILWTKGGGQLSVTGILSSPYILNVVPASLLTCQLLSVSDAAGCNVVLNVPFTVGLNPAPNVNLGTDKTIKLSESVVLNAGAGFAGYQWSTGNTTSSVQINGATLGPGTHPISVTVTNSYYCKDSDTVIVTVVDDTGLDEGQTPTISLFPNPAHDIVYLDLASFSAEIVRLELLSAQGEVVYTKIIATKQLEHSIDIHTFSPGIYVLRLYSSQILASCKFVIAH